MLENQSLKMDAIIEEITQTLNCSVLKKHVSTVFKESMDFELSNLSPYQIAMLFGENIRPLNIYQSLPDDFWNRHKIEIKSQANVICELNKQASKYCCFSIYPEITPDITTEIKQLKKINTASKRLRQLLPSSEDGLYSILKVIGNIEVGSFHSDKIDLFFANLNQYLQTLEGLYDKIPLSAYGQLTKIGSKSPQGNLALRVWVLLTNLIWTEILGRSFIYDGPNGVSGPARFTNFAFEALLPLHLEIEHHQVEYAVRAFREQPEITYEALRPKNTLSPT